MARHEYERGYQEQYSDAASRDQCLMGIGAWANSSGGSRHPSSSDRSAAERYNNATGQGTTSQGTQNYPVQENRNLTPDLYYPQNPTPRNSIEDQRSTAQERRLAQEAAVRDRQALRHHLQPAEPIQRYYASPEAHARYSNHHTRTSDPYHNLAGVTSCTYGCHCLDGRHNYN